ncbi:MAG: integrase core domain-containing protein [Actinomycetota bacterium]|nr:integrase core domain-containing protein [Actinomycetota bacterium]
MAPATSLARLRKQVLDLVANKRMKVREACGQLGISKSRYYELRARYLLYREAGLLPKPRPPERPDRRLPAPLVDQIVAYAVEHPTEGPRTIAAALVLPRFGSWRVSHGGISNVLRRAGLERRSARLAAAEALAATEGGPITERVLRDIRAREVIHRHIGSDQLGEQVFLDTMYVGKLKGVGKIWQYSAVEGACSFGFAEVRAGEKSARTAASFLEHQVLPVYREAGIALVEVVVDGGPEFKGEFTRTCRRLGISVHRLPPRSPDLNAFVERFQGTVLHLHYRTAFRYRFYTLARDIDADLQAWLRFYNFERPHRGYRTKGRRPAEIFYAHAPALLVMKGWEVDEFTPQTVRS